MLRTSFNAQLGFVEVISAGFITLAELPHCLIEMDEAFRIARKATGELKILSDARDAAIQSAEVMAVFQDRPLMVTGPTDRSAIVTSSSLTKMQVSRLFRSDREKAFVSRTAALTWLMASRAGQRKAFDPEAAAARLR